VVPNITLNNGVEIPQLGFGVFQIEPKDTKDATLAALEVGYRHIDTAEMYGNEKEVGEAVRASGIDRGEIFVTSKLNNSFHAYDAALDAFEGTLKALDIDYVDMFLIHWPLPGVGDFVETWQAMEKMYEGGRVKAIGVSNFQPHHLRRILGETSVTPAANQVEVHPYLTNDEVRAFDSEHGIATEAWSPIAQGKVLKDPTIVRIAENLGKSPRPGHPALAPPARRHHLPQVGDPVPGRGELRPLRLRALRRGHGRHHRPEQGRAHRPRSGRVQLRPGVGALGAADYQGPLVNGHSPAVATAGECLFRRGPW
jgi:2,5-diketo-D-gluconate reductase A